MTLEEWIWKEKEKKKRKQRKILTSKLSLKNMPCIFFPACTNSRVQFVFFFPIMAFSAFLLEMIWKMGSICMLSWCSFCFTVRKNDQNLEKKIFCGFFFLTLKKYLGPLQVSVDFSYSINLVHCSCFSAVLFVKVEEYGINSFYSFCYQLF